MKVRNGCECQLIAFAVFVGVFCGTAVGVAVWAAPKAWVLVKPILHVLTA